MKYHILFLFFCMLFVCSCHNNKAEKEESIISVETPKSLVLVPKVDNAIKTYVKKHTYKYFLFIETTPRSEQTSAEYLLGPCYKDMLIGTTPIISYRIGNKILYFQSASSQIFQSHSNKNILTVPNEIINVPFRILNTNTHSYTEKKKLLQFPKDVFCYKCLVIDINKKGSVSISNRPDTLLFRQECIPSIKFHLTHNK